MIQKKYTKKPIAIEAVQLSEDNAVEVFAWISAFHSAVKLHELADETHIVIHTLEGDMQANVGDYVIRGIKGEFYPCRPDIFKASYVLSDGKD